MRDTQFMTRAIELAKRGRFTTAPNPNVGCVLVKQGVIVGEGWHQRAGEAHAEVNALSMAGEQAAGATAYVTLEPCGHYGRTPPCCDALMAAGVSRVVAAMQDPNPQVAGRGLHRLSQAGIEVSSGLLSEQAEAINRGFLKRMRTGFPWVQLKLGASLDGRTAMDSGESRWITSAAARADVQIFRAQSPAILTTSHTVLADDPAMTVRWQELDPEARRLIGDEAQLRQPIRILLDSQNRVPPRARLFQQPGETWRFFTEAPPQDSLQQRTFQIPNADGHADLVALLILLGKQQINSVWVEAGATLAGALINAGVVDELIVYLAPRLLGNEAKGLCALPGLHQLADAPHFKFQDICQIGNDLRIILQPE